MDNFTNEKVPPTDSPGPDQANSQHKTEPNRAQRVVDGFRSAFRHGAEDARKAAEKAIPRVKTAAADAAYTMAYGISFAVVFQWAAVKELAPESVKSGVRA